MNIYNCHIKQVNNSFEVCVHPLLTGALYALYVLIKPVGDKNFKRVYRFKYTESNVFRYISEIEQGEIIFQYFVKLDDEILCNSVIKVNANYRKIVNVNQLSFKTSFDVDVINKYITPIKYQKLNNLKRHIILFNGALSSKSFKYPIYSRGTWSKKFNCNTLNIFDATLNLSQDYLLSWYQGTSETPLIPDVIEIIEKLKCDNGLENKDLVFYGSSGGGWIALKLAESFPGVTCVAINPQIHILDYNIKSVLDKFLAVSFNGLDINDAKNLYTERLSICPEGFKGNVDSPLCHSSRFILVQNLRDSHHYEEHFLGFWKEFSDEIETGWDSYMKNYCMIYEHPSGHAGEPEEVFEEILHILSYFEK